jgi:mRNA-degrading endonuclease RelE of RelBE toxin-antitoxin system
MAEAFRVQSTRGFDRLIKAHRKRHREFSDLLDNALAILETDPLNNTRRHSIGKLADVKPGDGQYRLRLGRWRFRYDVSGAVVTLRYCGLRREDTYR